MVNVRAISKPLMGEISSPRRISLALVLVLSLALALTFVLSGRESDSPDHATGLTTDALVNFYEDRIERDPADFISYNGLAGVFIRGARETGDVSDYNRAEASLRRSLAILPEARNFRALAQLGSVFNAKHMFDDGAELGRRAISQKPNSAQGYAVLGDALIALGRYEEARSQYQRAAEIEPGLASYSRMARLHELHGDLIAAETAWWSAHRTTFRARAENSAWVHVQLGHLYFNQGNYERASEQYSQALTESENYAHALAGLGKPQAALGQFSASVEYYRRAIDQIPSPEYVVALGETLDSWQKPDEARHEYALVAAIEKLYEANGINTNLQMAKFVADHGIASDAVARARVAYDARPDIYASDALAWALYQAGQHREALSHSIETLRLGTRDAQMMFHAGMIRFRLGDLEESEQLLSSALELNPGFSTLYGDLARSTVKELRDITNADANRAGR